MIHSIDSNCSQQASIPTNKHIDHKCFPSSYSSLSVQDKTLIAFTLSKHVLLLCLVMFFWMLSMVLCIIICLRITTLPKATEILKTNVERPGSCSASHCPVCSFQSKHYQLLFILNRFTRLHTRIPCISGYICTWIHRGKPCAFCGSPGLVLHSFLLRLKKKELLFTLVVILLRSEFKDSC